MCCPLPCVSTQSIRHYQSPPTRRKKLRVRLISERKTFRIVAVNQAQSILCSRMSHVPSGDFSGFAARPVDKFGARAQSSMTVQTAPAQRPCDRASSPASSGSCAMCPATSGTILSCLMRKCGLWRLAGSSASPPDSEEDYCGEWNPHWALGTVCAAGPAHLHEDSPRRGLGHRPADPPSFRFASSCTPLEPCIRNRFGSLMLRKYPAGYDRS